MNIFFIFHTQEKSSQLSTERLDIHRTGPRGGYWKRPSEMNDDTRTLNWLPEMTPNCELCWKLCYTPKMISAYSRNRRPLLQSLHSCGNYDYTGPRCPSYSLQCNPFLQQHSYASGHSQRYWSKLPTCGLCILSFSDCLIVDNGSAYACKEIKDPAEAFGLPVQRLQLKDQMPLKQWLDTIPH